MATKGTEQQLQAEEVDVGLDDMSGLQTVRFSSLPDFQNLHQNI